MIRNSYVKAICMGVIAGMRSMSAPAFTSSYLAQKHSKQLADSPFSLMGSPQVAKVLKVATLGEMVADQLPGIGARTAPGPLVARALSGALCGAAICTAEGERAEVGALAGALSAIGSAYAFYHLRRELGESQKIPDAALGLTEDAIVLGGRFLLGDPEVKLLSESANLKSIPGV
jgi:uncharacterized membrane protein